MKVGNKLTGLIVGITTGGALLLSGCSEKAEQEQAAPAGPPPLAVTLAPHATGQTIDRLDVTMKLPAPDVRAGGKLLRMPTTIVSTPTARYGSNDLSVSDDKGPLVLTEVDENPTPTGVYRHWTVDRDTVGDVTVKFGTAPRYVDASTRNGPLFDLRQQGDGLMGAGVYFYALPATETPYTLKMHWDMSDAPEGTRGIWSLGEGDQTTVAPAEVLAFSYYAVGPVKSEPQTQGDFGFYWLSEPPFDAKKTADDIHALYSYMANFFGDVGSTYRVFLRLNPYPAGGGSGLAKSFMFGVGDSSQGSVESPAMLLAHETAHNWPRLNGGEPHALTAWYTEGTAEYYSSMLSLRAGVIDLDKFLEVINGRARDYYTNAHLNLTNEEAGQIFWTDSRAQRVPYGRGFMYFTGLNADLKRASGGKRSLDDLVIEVRNRQEAGESIGLTEWKEILKRELGQPAVDTFDAMVAGQTIVPAADSLAPCFTVEQVSEKPFVLGYDRMSLKLVTGLEPDSEAAKAGLQNGDKILSFTALDDLRKDPAKMMEVTVERGGQQLSFSYSPRGAATDAWVWQRNDSVPADSCGL
ncbi:MAG: hypothetical protein EP335_03260 [Alphaproteobacteria bacterium]|nr:MAG: hypothetical protein EP335_03260 [Alphaproteobacteria bacterium]